MPDRRLRYFVVDAFTNRPFTGNPAAVVPLDHWPADPWLRSVAMEMNLSETAFFVPSAGGFDLRWFTPKAEVDLCGHATIASAVVLAELGTLADGSSVNFSTRSGVLGAERHGSRILLDFPALAAESCPPPPGLLESLNVAACHVARSKFDYLIEVESENVLRGVRPDFKQLLAVKCRGVVVTAPSDDPQFDFVSRFFAPAVGVDEDPVTGSAHCLLAPHWAARLGKSKMTAYQASARGGIVHVETRGERVLLGGEGVIFAMGEIAIGVGP
jgi:predicted PhzF superfamily epimerase YddE/YHI9